jgi:hypothetical protein
MKRVKVSDAPFVLGPGRDGDLAYVRCKGTPEQVLELIDDQLKQFGLEVIMFDSGWDDYIWSIDKRSEAPPPEAPPPEAPPRAAIRTGSSREQPKLVQ